MKLESVGGWKFNVKKLTDTDYRVAVYKPSGENRLYSGFKTRESATRAKDALMRLTRQLLLRSR